MQRTIRSEEYKGFILRVCEVNEPITVVGGHIDNFHFRLFVGKSDVTDQIMMTPNDPDDWMKDLRRLVDLSLKT